MTAKLSSLRTLLHEQSLDGLFISSLQNITYLTGYSGFSKEDRDAFVLITEKAQYIFTHGIYKEDVKAKVKDFKLIDIKRESPISASLKELVDKHEIKKLGFEAFDLTVAEFERLTKQINKQILLPSNAIAHLRIYKSPDEILKLKKACALGDKAFTFILEKIKPSVSESEIAAYLEFFFKTQNADASFPTIVAFEENAVHPHHMPTTKKLEADQFVLMDFGTLVDGYCSDMTRTIILGRASKEKEKAYQTVYDAQQKAIAYITKRLAKKEIVRASHVDKTARDYIVAQGYDTMPHSLGHGIGLEVHEAPRLTPVTDELLEEGMVFSIEPGIYIPGKMGIRIEDLFAIENYKLTQLTKSPGMLVQL